MLNVGGGEFLVILLVALIVLGPQKLPEAARQVAGVARELRRISAGFQAEMKAAMDDPIEAAARERGNAVAASTEEHPAPADQPTGPSESPAAAAGMYDVFEAAAANDGLSAAPGRRQRSTDTDRTGDDGAAAGVDGPGQATGAPEDAGSDEPAAGDEAAP